MDINVVRPVIQDLSHASAMSIIPISFRRLISMQGLIISKAVDKSSNASILDQYTEPCLFSRFDSKSLDMLVSAVSLDSLGM